MKQKKSLQFNAILNGIKQGSAVVMSLLTFPYVSRVLGVEYYGKVSFSVSVLTYVCLLAALGIANYAIRECSFCKNDPEKLRTTVNEIFTLNICSTVVAYFLLAMALLFWPKISEYTLIILLICPYILTNTLACDWLNNVFEDFTYITVRQLIGQLIFVIMVFVFVHDQEDYLWYAFIIAVPQLFAHTLNLFYIRRSLGVHPRVVFSKGILRHIKSVLIIFGSTVGTQIYVASDTTLLGLIGTDTMVGLYSVASQIYTIVKTIFNAMLAVCIPRFSYELSQGLKDKVRQQLNLILSVLIFITVPAAVGLCALSRPIVTLISGEEYAPAAVPLAILGLAIIFAAVGCFFVDVVMLPHKLEKKILVATSVSAVVNIVLNLILIPYLGATAAAITTVIAEMMMVGFGIFYTKHLYRFDYLKPIASGIGGGALVYGCCALVAHFTEVAALQIVLSMPLAIVAVALWALLIFRKELLSMKSFLGK